MIPKITFQFQYLQYIQIKLLVWISHIINRNDILPNFALDFTYLINFFVNLIASNAIISHKQTNNYFLGWNVL